MGFINDLNDRVARLPIAYGRHVVKGFLTKHLVELVGTETQVTVQQALGAQPWDSIEKLYYAGLEIDAANYHFHSGGDTDAVDAYFPNDVIHPAASSYSARLPTGIADDNNPDKMVGIFKTLKVADYDEEGVQTGFAYSPSPARQVLDLMLRAKRSIVRVNYPAWCAWRDDCAEAIDWDDGALTPHHITIAAGAGGSLADGTYWVRIATLKGADISSASKDRADDGVSTASVEVTDGKFTVEWTSQEDRGATGYRVYIGTAEGTEDRYFVVGSGATNTLTVTTLAGATMGAPPEVATGALIRQIPRFESHVFFKPPFELSAALDKIAQITCSDWQYANGKLVWLTPQMRDPVMTLDLSSIANFRTWQVDRRSKPNQIVVNYRDLDNQYLSPADPPVTVNRAALQAKEGVRPFEIDGGCMYRSQAWRVANYWARRLIDSDQMLEVLGAPRTYFVLPGDPIAVTHNVPNWEDVEFYVEAKDEAEDTKAGYDLTARLYGAWYSDTDGAPLPRPLPSPNPSPLIAPPVVSDVDLEQIAQTLSTGIPYDAVRGTVQFQAFAGSQRGRVWVQDPDDVGYRPTHLVLTPDPATLQASFDLPATAGLWNFRVVTESTLGVSESFASHPVFSITVTESVGTIGGADSIVLVDEDTPSQTLTVISRSNPVLSGPRTLTLNVKNNHRALNLGGDLSLAHNFTTSGNFTLTLTTTGNTNVTLPTSGTLATLAGAESLINKKLGSLVTNGPIYTSGGDGTLNSELRLALVRGGTAADLSATGGSGQYLKQASAGAVITVGVIPATDIGSGAALTKVDDTNVTLTLGGLPTAALLAATSLTLSWTGVLASSRGGTGVNNAGTLTNASNTTITGGGTIALAGFTLTVPTTGTAALGAGTLTVATSNSTASSAHTHGITSSSNPGAAASLLATDASGYLTVVRLTATDYLLVNASTANLYLKDTSTGWQSASSTVVTPQANNAVRSTSYTSGLLGWNISAAGNAEFNNLDLRGALHAGLIVYNALQATAGTFGVFKSAAKLKNDVTVPAGPTYGTTTVNIDCVDQDGISHAASQLFVANDILRMKDGLTGDTWFKVSSASDQTTFWRYVAIIMAGTANVTYRAGLGVVDYGQSGAGFIIQTADQSNAPYLQMATHAASFSSQDAAGSLTVTPQLRLGNLNGSFGYATDIYGLGAGQYGTASKSWVTVEQTNGFRAGINTTTRVSLTTTGVLTLNDSAGTAMITLDASAGFFLNGKMQVSGASASFALGTTPPTSASAGTGIWIDRTGLFGLNSNTVNFKIDATNGNITAIAGTIASWTLASTRLSSTNVFIDQAGQYISMGASPPTSYGSNVGVFIEGANSGRLSLYKDANNYLQWDSSKLLVKAANFTLDSSGNLTASSATISGAITATSGSITGTLSMSGASSAIAIGSTPPSSATVGTGLWLDRTGMYGLASSVQQAIFSATTGKITAGAGGVVLDSAGISLLSGNSFSTVTSYKFYNGGNSLAYFTAFYDTASGFSINEVDLKAEALTGADTRMQILAYAPAGRTCSITLVSNVGAGLQSALSLGTQVDITGNATVSGTFIGGSDIRAIGLLKAGSGPTTLTDSTGKILTAAFADQWFDQNVKTTASPTHAGLTLTGIAKFDSHGVQLVRGTGTLANGQNDSVTVPANVSYATYTGPTGAYSITGFNDTADGRVLCVYFNVGQTLTIKHDNAGTAAGKRITTATQADVTFAANKPVRCVFIYDASVGAGTGYWVLFSASDGTTAGF